MQSHLCWYISVLAGRFTVLSIGFQHSNAHICSDLAIVLKKKENSLHLPIKCFVSLPTASSVLALQGMSWRTEDVQAGTGGSREGDAVRRGWLEQEAVPEPHWHHHPLSSAPVFFLAQPHLPLPKRSSTVAWGGWHSSRQKWRWMARELLGVEWGWSSTTILSPSPLSTAPSPDSSQCRPITSGRILAG